MFQLSAMYTLLATFPMFIAIAYDRMYGSGNHWFLFDTRLDQIFQYFGFMTIAIVSAPLAAALFWSLVTKGARDNTIVGIFFIICIVVSSFFTLMVLD